MRTRKVVGPTDEQLKEIERQARAFRDFGRRIPLNSRPFVPDDQTIKDLRNFSEQCRPQDQNVLPNLFDNADDLLIDEFT